MASDAAHFELDDLILPLEPHLVAHHTTQVIDAPAVDQDVDSRSSTPDPPDEHEVLIMRTRALAIRERQGNDRENLPENGLVDMVLRLTAALPARMQILDQAGTIRRLSLQQDFLLQRMNDERASWDAERDGMHRICEALIAQANIASHNLYKEQESSKKPALIESENVSLRQKLADAQSRVLSLEAELAQLRPLLLMQPSVIAQSRGLTLQTGKHRKKEGDGHNENRSYYREREEKAPVSKSRKKKAAAYFKHAPTIADARSEHLLLAARKLGKERATMVSQAMYRPAEPQPPSAAPNHDLTLHVQGRGNDIKPMMSPAVWQTQQHVQQHGVQHLGQQQPGTSKGTQNSPIPHYGSPGVAYAHPQPYFMPAGSIGRPGAAMPTPTFYPAPPHGYIPGPAWPYYPHGPYRFGQPITIQNANPNHNVNVSATRPVNTTPLAGPSCTPAPSTPQGTAESACQNGSGKDSSSDQVQEPPNEGPSYTSQMTPQSRSTRATSPQRNPPTPMDSLLSAARSVFSPESSSASRAAEDDGSPSPKKRRRVEQQSGQATGQSSEKPPAVSDVTATPERRTSALDVLADQAAGVLPSARRSRSGSVTPENEASSSRDKQPNSAPTQRSMPRRRRQSAGTSASGSSGTIAGTPTSEGNLPALAVRKGKRPARSSSTASASRTSSSTLAPTITVQRAASEEHTTTVTLTLSQISSDSFRLRPVEFVGNDELTAQSSPLPRTGSSSTRIVNASGTGRGRQFNGHAASSASLDPPPIRTPAAQVRRTETPSVDPDADAEGDEIESEDDASAAVIVNAEAEINQLEEDVPLRKNAAASMAKGNDLTQKVGSKEDVNSRRWLEILGRKDV